MSEWVCGGPVAANDDSNEYNHVIRQYAYTSSISCSIHHQKVSQTKLNKIISHLSLVLPPVKFEHRRVHVFET